MDDYGRKMKRPPADFKHVRDLQTLEGPLVSQFLADERDPYLFLWRDSDDEFNRWLAIPASEREIAMYEARQTTLAMLIARALTAFIADADARGRFRRWYSLTREDLPEEYEAAVDSFYNPSLRPVGEVQQQKILIDGYWTLDEIAKSARRFEEVYAAQQLLSEDPKARVRSDDPFGYSFKSGYAYHHFWQALNRWVFGARQREYKVNYASPGMIQFELHEAVATMVVRTVRELEQNLAEVHERYKEIHTWLLAQKRDEEAEQLKRSQEPSLNNSTVKVALKEFCQQLGSISYARIESLTKRDSVQTAEVVLSYYRKLRDLARIEMDERGILVSLAPDMPPPVRDGFRVDAQTDSDDQDG